MPTIPEERVALVIADALDGAEPEWLRLSSPRERAILATAIEEPDRLDDGEWRELAHGPTACGLRNLDSKTATVVLSVGAAAAIIPSLFGAPNWTSYPGFVAWLGGTAFFLISRARYQLRLRRARRQNPNGGTAT